jgi:hypothetical protein
MFVNFKFVFNFVFSKKIAAKSTRNAGGRESLNESLEEIELIAGRLWINYLK